MIRMMMRMLFEWVLMIVVLFKWVMMMMILVSISESDDGVYVVKVGDDDI